MFGRPGASILAPWPILVPWEPLVRPWEQYEGHVEVWRRNFIESGTIWESHFDSFVGTEDLITFVVRSRPISLFLPSFSFHVSCFGDFVSTFHVLLCP